MKKYLEVSRNITLGDQDVALVWAADGSILAYVPNEGTAQSLPPHLLQALAVMLSMGDEEIVGRMWEKLESRMDGELVAAAEAHGAEGGPEPDHADLPEEPPADDINLDLTADGETGIDDGGFDLDLVLDEADGEAPEAVAEDQDEDLDMSAFDDALNGILDEDEDGTKP